MGVNKEKQKSRGERGARKTNGGRENTKKDDV